MLLRILSVAVTVLLFTAIDRIQLVHAYDSESSAILDRIREHIPQSLKLPRQGYTYREYSDALQAWYQPGSFQPIWLENNKPSERAYKLKEAIEASFEHGQNPNDYFLKHINERWNCKNQRCLTELDLLLTLAAGRLAADSRYGRKDLRMADNRGYPDTKLIPPLLELALTDIMNRSDVDQAIAEQYPRHRQYQRMKIALAKYRDLQRQGVWNSSFGSKSIRPGYSGLQVLALARQLQLTGDLPDKNLPADKFDTELEAAVKLFQQRHGIPVTGEVHNLTLQALQVPLADRINTLIINLERWRWLARDFSRTKEIYVNIASFELFALDQGELALRLPVIVGKPFQATPVFSSQIEAIEVNPFWNIPTSIASNEILPKLRKNPDYLRAENMLVYDLSSGSPKLVSPESINWRSITSAEMNKFAIKQIPGKLNVLGTLKFLFPNPYSVFLHDTLNKTLFSKSTRAFSHGCIRVSAPEKLAIFVLDLEEDNWTGDRLNEVIASEKNQKIKLTKPVPIHITYRTAWVDLDHSIHYRPDIYNRDVKLSKLLMPAEDNDLNK